MFNYIWRYFLALVAIVLLVPSALAGDAVATPVSAATSDATPPVPLLWKVSHENSHLYLLGSFHFLKPDDYPLAAEVDEAYQAADTLVFELSPEEMTEALGAELMRVGSYSDGRLLRGELDAQTWQQLEVYATGSGISVSQFSSYKPWYVAMVISVIEMQKYGLTADAGLDRYFINLAKQEHKATAGLEQGADQLALFDSMTATQQQQMLAEALISAATGGEEIKALHQRWRAGDVQALWQVVGLKMQQQYPELYQRINTDRNNRWMPLLEERLNLGTGSALVVVGAMHLLESDGVVEKLKAKGYKVERLCAVCVPEVVDTPSVGESKPRRTRRGR